MNILILIDPSSRPGCGCLYPLCTNALSVIYWPSTELSIKRCTCVNKWKNSGSRWAWDNNITRCPGRFESVGERMPAWESACRLRVLRPPVTHGWATQSRWERSAAMVEEELGVNIAVCPCLQLISHTQPTSPFQE